MRTISAARTLGQGTREYENGKYIEAFRVLKPIADSDLSSIYQKAVVATAQYYIGLMYFYGDGVDADISTGASYIRRAAAFGHPEAAFYLKHVGLE